MFELKGSHGCATVYATNIEQAAITQIQQMLNTPLAENTRIAIMPDAHAGAGCTIGTTMEIHDKVCPNLTGVDLGCGLYVMPVHTANGKPIDLAALDTAVSAVPSGPNVHNTPLYSSSVTKLDNLRCCKHLKDLYRLNCSMGTLGGGKVDCLRTA